jgi:hypothetical protein
MMDSISKTWVRLVKGFPQLLGDRFFWLSKKYKLIGKFDPERFFSWNSFFTWHKRPKLARDLSSLRKRLSHDDVCIVIQGSISGGSKFVVETILSYKSMFPGAEIVVSTWETSPGKDLDRVRATGVNVVTSSLPRTPGVGNSNLQIVSSEAGVRLSLKLGKEFTLKTRSDQRIYSPSAISLMKFLVQKFPLVHNLPNQLSRLVFTSTGTMLKRVYGLSDFLTFGKTLDVLKYWSITDEESPAYINLARLSKYPEFSNPEIVPEVKICSQFLQRTGWKLEWTQEDWRRALIDRFLVLDAASLDLYWNKYSSREYLWRRYDDDETDEFTFGDWADLHNTG